MAVAHADPPLLAPEPVGVEPNLSLMMLEREHHGATTERHEDAHRLARFLEAPIVLGVREPQEFQARLAANSGQTSAELYAFADVAMREVEGERAVVLRCHASALTVALITVLDTETPTNNPGDVSPPVLFWSLTPRSADASARADMLDFLRIVHQGGRLEIVNAIANEAVGTLDMPGAPFDADLERDWHFLTDVATLEEWSGMVLPLPSEVPALEVARIQQAAEMVRTREVRVRFTQDITATVTPEARAPDELQLEQDFGIAVFGFDVPLGVGRARFPVEVMDTRSDAQRPDLAHVRLRSLQTEGEVVFDLQPPPGRVAEKRTLAPDEAPRTAEEPPWDPQWLVGEREVEDELRAGRGIRFTSEDAFLAWLADPDPPAAE